MQQLENALFALIIELMGGENNLRKGVSATRNSLHHSFDTVRNATVSGVTNMPERFKKSIEERQMRSGAGIATEGTIQKDKLQDFLRTSEPGMSEQERNYLCSRSTQLTTAIAAATKDARPEELKSIAIKTFKAEIKKQRETYALLTEYKRGGDQALTQACNFDKQKKEQFYQSLPGGKQLYERITQAKLEGRDTAALEKNVKDLIGKALNPPSQANTVTQANNLSRDNTAPGHKF